MLCFVCQSLAFFLVSDDVGNDNSDENITKANISGLTAVLGKFADIMFLYIIIKKKEPNELYIKLGSYRDDMLDDAEQWYQAAMVISHGKYTSIDTGTMAYDIALIQLTEPVKFNYFIGPVELPHPTASVELQSNCRSTGWGSDEDWNYREIFLKEVQLKAANNCELRCVACICVEPANPEIDPAGGSCPR
uniref:Peptidase S1 domain-containing protein n=1 Tax=Romanomermis culicivorax TaxID=13658 RepID=A0A915K0C6_ROMCU